MDWTTFSLGQNLLGRLYKLNRIVYISIDYMSNDSVSIDYISIDYIAY